MKKDQAIEDIREVRKQISRQHHDDITMLLDHYRSLETRYTNRLISYKRHHKQVSSSHKKDDGLQNLESIPSHRG